MLKWLTFLIFILGQYSLYANNYWKRDYTKIDSLASTIRATSDVNKLAFELTSSYSTDLEKYRSIFAWIAKNIEYDCEAKSKPSLRETNPDKIILKRKAVCSGYSNLFLKLCELANLECQVIHGWSTDMEEIGNNLPKKTTHSWNAIKLDNQWYLCDVTWGAGSSYGQCEFRFEYKDYYFCTPPRLFYCNHFPEQRKWLLGANLSKRNFINNPHFYPSAIEFNIENLKPKSGILYFKKNKVLKFEFLIDITPNKITMEASKEKYSTKINFSQKMNKIQFEYVLNKYSPYLTIYLDGQTILAYKMKK